MSETVVIAGDIDLINVIDGDLDLISTVDGECGIVYQVSKIPSNYGLITWDGTVLTVS